MTLRSITLIAPFVLLTALAGSAAAQTPPPGGGQGGAAMRGGMGPNGMMGLPRSADRVEEWSGRIFVRMDTNQDGSITGNELAILANPTVAAMGGSRMRAMIVQSDANRDARITAEEMAVGARRLFDRMDANGDGVLSDDELPQPPAAPPPIRMPTAEPANPFADMMGG